MKTFCKCVLAVVAALATGVALAVGEHITLESGAVITVPENGQVCRFDPVYCVGGWNEKGRFPFVEYGNAVREQLDNCRSEARDFPVCADGQLTVGGSAAVVFPCYRLDTGD